MHALLANDTRLKPFEALRAVRRLMANPEDTSQIFSIFRALRGRSGIKRLPPLSSKAPPARPCCASAACC